MQCEEVLKCYVRLGTVRSRVRVWADSEGIDLTSMNVADLKALLELYMDHRRNNGHLTP